jgi:hypothetical protein
MKKKYRNKLPKGAEVTGFNAHVDNGELIVDVEFKDKFLPKDGDFLHDKYYDITVIYKETYKTGGIVTYVGINKNNIVTKTGLGFGMTKEFRYATPEEKSAFLERLESEAHLRWNAETKKLEPIRWRAERNGIYWFIDPHGRGNKTIDVRSNYDNDMYDIGNYFRTPEAAQKVADKIKEIFKNSKAE